MSCCTRAGAVCSTVPFMKASRPLPGASTDSITLKSDGATLAAKSKCCCLLAAMAASAVQRGADRALPERVTVPAARLGPRPPLLQREDAGAAMPMSARRGPCAQKRTSAVASEPKVRRLCVYVPVPVSGLGGGWEKNETGQRHGAESAKEPASLSPVERG